MKLQAGKYWIGDPCYVLQDDPSFDWCEFVSFTFDGDPSGRLNEGTVDHQGIKFSFFGTQYGDGCYPDNMGNYYDVDAGCLACIPVDNITVNNLGKVHEFLEPFECSYDEENGAIYFGDITIATGDEIEEDEEVYY